MRFILFLCLFGWLGCQDNPSATFIRSKTNTKAVIPDTLHAILLPNKDTIPLELHGRVKIVTRIAGDCGTCITALSGWEKLLKEWNKFDISFLCFIASSSGYERFEWVVSEQVLFSRPVIYDVADDFLKKNGLPKENKWLHTFLLDKDNKIVLVGSPLYSPKLEALYEKKIKDLISAPL